MKQSWTSGLDKEVAAGMRQAFKEALLVRARLSAMLEKMADTSVRASHSKSEYDAPNWAYKQADSRGYERALREVIGLLSDS